MELFKSFSEKKKAEVLAPTGAAARIRHFVEHGVPENFIRNKEFEIPF